MKHFITSLRATSKEETLNRFKETNDYNENKVYSANLNWYTQDWDIYEYDLKEGDYIAFEYEYEIGDPEIIVDNISFVYEDRVIVHFLYGYKSETCTILKKDILAIGNKLNGTTKLLGWTGLFDIVNETDFLIKNIEYETKSNS